MRNRILRIAGVVAALFGIATIAAGGNALFVDRAGAGSIVPFVLWFNFAAGFIYVAAGAALWSGWRWASGLAVVLAALNALVFAALGGHIEAGGAYEARTVAAMTLRTVLWVAIALAACSSSCSRHGKKQERKDLPCSSASTTSSS